MKTALFNNSGRDIMTMVTTMLLRRIYLRLIKKQTLTILLLIGKQNLMKMVIQMSAIGLSGPLLMVGKMVYLKQMVLR